MTSALTPEKAHEAVMRDLLAELVALLGKMQAGGMPSSVTVAVGLATAYSVGIEIGLRVAITDIVTARRLAEALGGDDSAKITAQRDDAVARYLEALG